MRRTIRTRVREASKRAVARVIHKARGDIYNLQKIFDKLNRRYFNNEIVATIEWGRRRQGSSKRRHETIIMGRCFIEDKFIRVHPSLDRKFVPRYFVEWIVFHEMIHQKNPVFKIKGRHQFHTPEFHAEEATFKHHLRAQQWEKKNLHRLLYF